MAQKCQKTAHSIGNDLPRHCDASHSFAHGGQQHPRTSDYLYKHEPTVTAQQLASVAQLVRALHRNRRAVGSIPTRGPCAEFFAVVPDQILNCIT